MREWKDHSGRLTVWLSDDGDDFGPFAHQMISRFGQPTVRLDGLDQRYWDFAVPGATVVLHSDTMAGISIHVEDGTHDNDLRSIGEWLTKERQSQNQAAQATAPKVADCGR
jgi:hypothetical protein